MTKTNYQKHVGRVLDKLSEKQKMVVVRRFGLIGSPTETLQCIGDDFGITRERVRQIETEAINKLSEIVQDDQDLNVVFVNFKKHLQKNGGFQKEDVLLKELSAEDQKNAAYFLLTLGQPFYRHPETNQTFAFWSLDKDVSAKTNQVVQTFLKKLTQIKKPLLEKEILALEKDISNNFCLACLNTTKKIDKGPLGGYGLSKWPEIQPRGVKDAAFLALKKSDKPLHFRDIAIVASDLLSEFLSNRKVLPQTVHNELIRDDRFVLVGRGTYGLKEWGYQPGTVKDVICAVLKDNGPLAKEQVAEMVLEKRLVKPNTIFLNLNNKAVFNRDDQNRYYVI